MVLLQAITTRLKQKSNAEWNLIFAGEKVASGNGHQSSTATARAKFAYGPVNNLSEVFRDPQVKCSQMERTMKHITVGSIKQVCAQPIMLYKCYNVLLKHNTDIL